MDYEKKYNEAMLRADEAVQKGCLDKDMFDIIFPPEESEDEKAKKIIASVFSEAGNRYIQKSERDIVLAYLEKQKEQKPVEWKPTEEQMNALNFAITYFMHETNYKNPTELRDLYDDLLKLKQP